MPTRSWLGQQARQWFSGTKRLRRRNARSTVRLQVEQLEDRLTPSTPTIYSFTGAGSDGENPVAGLIADRSGDLFGTTQNGGTSNNGTVFELVKTDSGYTHTTLYSFGMGSDGQHPVAGLIADASGDLFGTTVQGGASNNGTVFELAKTDSGYMESILYSFGTGSDGQHPMAGLIADTHGDLFGTTQNGGTSNNGTVFELVKSGSNYTHSTLYSFGTGSDGQHPVAGLIMASSDDDSKDDQGSGDDRNGDDSNDDDSNGDLFGTTQNGGTSNNGTVFELVKTDSGYMEKILYSFGTGSDGQHPLAGLIADGDGDLFGTTSMGGASNNGTVFELAKSGSGHAESILISFGTGSDGQHPVAGLLMDTKGDLFGTTQNGGTSNDGTVFEARNVTTMTLVSGNNQSGTVGTALANPLVVQITDSDGNPVAGVTVNFAAASGGGSVSAPSSVTDSDGDASIIATLGSSPDNDTFTATLSGLTGSPVTFTATANPAPSPGPLPAQPPQQTVGIYNPGTGQFNLSNILGNPGLSNNAFVFPRVSSDFSWLPIAGNFSGTGQDTVGLYDPNNAAFHIATALGGAPDVEFQWTAEKVAADWLPVVGHFFAGSTDTVGLYDPDNMVFHLSTVLGNPTAAQEMSFAVANAGTGWVPIAANFTGSSSGLATTGLYDPNNAIFHISTTLGGASTNDFQFGNPSGGVAANAWHPIAGNFGTNAAATVGLYDPNNTIFHISNVLATPGPLQVINFQYGGVGWLPIAGDWDFPTLPQLSADGEGFGAAPVTQDQLQSEVQVALNLLASDGVNSALRAKLGSLQFTVGQLPAGYLGLSNLAAGTVEISSDAAGYGWFTDANPSDSVPANRMDLLTVVLHEMGHFDGWTELDPAMHPDALMALTLGTGQRRIDALDAVFAAGL